MKNVILGVDPGTRRTGFGLIRLEGDRMILKTAGADIACFDLDNCSFKEFKARNGAITSMSTDGNFVYVYDKKNVTKVGTR